MPVIDTSQLRPGEKVEFNDQVYNALDACITLEVFEELCTLSNSPPPIYTFERALQAPVLEMMLRGFRVDEYERQKALEEIRKKRGILQARLNQMSRAVWGADLNPRSTKQLRAFFYEWMHLPQVFINQKGERKLSMNREALERLDVYLLARPIIACILTIRDLEKQEEQFETLLDEDRRFRTSFNIAGTDTWRFSSSKSSTGTGGNIQNIKRDDDIGKGELSTRRPFIADPGFKLCEIDLEQAESRECGWIFGCLFGKWDYLDACEQGDLHTTTAKLIWPTLVHDRTSAEKLFYRHFTYRDMSKRGGHLTNYMGTAFTAARNLKVPQPLMDRFQSDYATGPHAAFPEFPKWWQWTARELQTKMTLYNSFGVERNFFDRVNDDATLRAAIAHQPQSSTAMRTNLGLWKIWRYMPEVQVMAQRHDSVTFQFRECEPSEEIKIVKRACEQMSCKLTFKGRNFDVPCDAKTGWNWGSYDAKMNPDGMKKLKGEDMRKRLKDVDRVL
jgi:DNA polymerase I-like protein with 3'-5' exonuclease and polymerase domains